jgi:hypothetical protein
VSGKQRQTRPFDERRYVLQPHDKREVLTVAQAAKRAGYSDGTIRSWCQQHAIGRQIVHGNWMVSRVALPMLVDGEMEALAEYHARNWTDPTVIAYFEKEGLRDLIKSQQTSNGKLSDR